MPRADWYKTHGGTNMTTPEQRELLRAAKIKQDRIEHLCTPMKGAKARPVGSV